MSRRPAHEPPRRTFQLAGRFPQDAMDGVLTAGADLTVGARTQERFSSSATSWWPHVAPRRTQTAVTPAQPETRKLGRCSEFLDSGGWAIQDSNLGPLPYQENLLSPPVVPTRT